MFRSLVSIGCSLSILSCSTFASEHMTPMAKISPKNNPLANQYIVIFKSNTPDVQIKTKIEEIRQHNRLNRTKNFKPLTHFKKLKGFAATISPKQLAALKQNPQVKSIEANRVIELADYSVAKTNRAITTDVWGIDRLDQATLPLDNSYGPIGAGSGAHAYIIDTGIRTTHNEFNGRASWGFTASNITEGNTDDNGHGTHMAGIVGGSTYGVAPSVNLHGVKVLDSQGQGTLAGLIEGIEYVTNNHQSPAVAVVGVTTDYSSSLNHAINTSIDAGVIYAVAAGDEDGDACDYSPSSSDEAFTVAASTINDSASIYTNNGLCVDIYAPGLYVKSAWHTGDHVNNTISHSPLAAAHVAGAAAILRGLGPECNVENISLKMHRYSRNGVITNIPALTDNILIGIPDASAGDLSCQYQDWISFLHAYNKGPNMTDIGDWATVDDYAYLGRQNLYNSDLPPIPINVSSIYGLTVDTNNLTNLDFMQGVNEVRDSLSIERNPITSLTGLSDLNRIDGSFYFGYNSVTTTLAGLESLTYIGVKVSIRGLNNLTDISALSNLTSAGARYSHGVDFLITRNPKLQSLHGLEKMTRFTGRTDFSQNDLRDVDGLSGLTTIEESLVLSNNPNLTNIDGLSNLTTAGRFVIMYTNITNLNGLSSVVNVGSLFNITENSALVDISGIRNMTPSTFTHLHMDNPAQYTTKPPLGSPFCNAVAAGTILPRYRDETTYKTIYLTEAEVCQ